MERTVGRRSQLLEAMSFSFGKKFETFWSVVLRKSNHARKRKGTVYRCQNATFLSKCEAPKWALAGLAQAFVTWRVAMPSLKVLRKMSDALIAQRKGRRLDRKTFFEESRRTVL